MAFLWWLIVKELVATDRLGVLLANDQLSHETTSGERNLGLVPRLLGAWVFSPPTSPGHK